jgi:2-hydroxy-4-carboxymuconate semialdehyde hemiacetal dehydrogenase
MKLAMVGYGSIAEYHVEALNSVGRLRDEAEEVVWRSVVGRDREATAEFARRHGFAASTTDLDSALADPELDAVVVTSPTDLHFEHVEKSLRAGKHVLAEIPLATSLGEADRLAALASERDLRLMVCHTQRYYPAFVEVRRRVAAGELHVQHVIYRYTFYRRDTVNWRGKRRTWADNLLWHHGAHVVDTALWLLGAGEVEVAGFVARPTPPLDIPMDLGLVLRTPLDQLVTVAMSYNNAMPVNDCLVIGEEETLLVEGGKLSTRDRVLHTPPEGEGNMRQAILEQDREFLAAVREGRAPSVDPAAVRPAMEVLQIMRERR